MGRNPSYTSLRECSIAYEFARAGRNAHKAAQRLRDEYETFPKISSSTILRRARSAAFIAVVEKYEAQLIDECNAFISQKMREDFRKMLRSNDPR